MPRKQTTKKQKQIAQLASVVGRVQAMMVRHFAEAAASPAVDTKHIALALRVISPNSFRCTMLHYE
jgi:predicted urease superfamily metal-dependent hydrolase